MRTFILSICAIFCAACAFAQTSFISSVDFNVAGQVQATDENGLPLDDSYTVPSTDATVHITFNGYDADYATTHGIMPMLMYTTGTGFAISEPQYEVLDPSDSNFSFSLDGKWGNPSMGNYYATLMICFLDSEMDYVFGSDGEPLFWQVSYSTANESPATLEYVYPNGNWEEESFAEAYKNGEIRFSFTNSVSFEDETAIGIIDYVMVDGSVVEPVILELGVNADAGWNPLDGYYAVAAKYSLPDVSADQIKEITVTLFDMESKGETVSVDPVTLENDNINVQRLAKQTKKTKIGESMVANSDNVNVYNISGVLVKGNIPMSEVANLPAGLYIVNGKTIVVR